MGNPLRRYALTAEGRIRLLEDNEPDSAAMFVRFEDRRREPVEHASETEEPGGGDIGSVLDAFMEGFERGPVGTPEFEEGFSAALDRNKVVQSGRICGGSGTLDVPAEVATFVRRLLSEHPEAQTALSKLLTALESGEVYDGCAEPLEPMSPHELAAKIDETPWPELTGDEDASAFVDRLERERAEEAEKLARKIFGLLAGCFDPEARSRVLRILAAPLSGDGWTYCHHEQPAAPGAYTVSVSTRRGGGPLRGLRGRCWWDGSAWAVPGVYAWRPARTAPLTREAMEYLGREGA